MELRALVWDVGTKQYGTVAVKIRGCCRKMHIRPGGDTIASPKSISFSHYQLQPVSHSILAAMKCFAIATVALAALTEVASAHCKIHTFRSCDENINRPKTFSNTLLPTVLRELSFRT